MDILKTENIAEKVKKN